MIRQDRIETREESGFVYAISPETARRQLKISGAIAAALAIGAIAIGSLGHIQPRHREPAIVKLTVQAPGVLQVQQAGAKSTIRPGG